MQIPLLRILPVVRLDRSPGVVAHRFGTRAHHFFRQSWKCPFSRASQGPGGTARSTQSLSGWQRKTPPERGPRFTTMVSVVNSNSACNVSRACPVAHPASTQSQGMGQLVESRQGLPDNPDLLRRDVGALSHGLPGEVSCERFVNTALHDSAALASSVRNKRSDKAFFPRRYPLVREQTAHDQFPLACLTDCVSACGAVAMELGVRRTPTILRKGAALPRCSQASTCRHQLGGGGFR